MGARTRRNNGKHLERNAVSLGIAMPMQNKNTRGSEAFGSWDTRGGEREVQEMVAPVQGAALLATASCLIIDSRDVWPICG